MSRYRVANAAKADLAEIWVFIAKDSVRAADRIQKRILSRFPLLAARPSMGRIRPELLPDLRSFAVGKYLIFFRLTDDGIEVYRILHGARDLPSILADDVDGHDDRPRHQQ